MLTVNKGGVHASRAHAVDFYDNTFADRILQSMEFVPKENNYYYM